MMNKQNSLAFQLVEAGYDVWLGNNRGNSNSRDHEFLDPMDQKDSKYWDFSIQEMGLYDTKAQVSKIQNLTGFQKITYVGYSHGST